MYLKELFCTFAHEIGYVEGTTVPSFVRIMPNMISKDTVNQIVEDFLVDSNYYLVDIKIVLDNHISVEIDSFDGVRLEFCAELNRHIQSLLDREVEDYELDVSSAGLTEPFKVTKQYEKNIGNDVEVLTKTGQKYIGELLESNDNGFVLQIEKTEKPVGSKRKITVSEDLTFLYEDIKTTKYIIRFK